VKRRVRIFVSYSHEDKEWFRKLQPLLVFSSRPQVAHVWHDHQLEAGDRWDEEIRGELQEMDIFLCLVTNHFLASSYITKVELKEAFRREKNKQTIIVPILICDMAEEDIKHLKPFNPLPTWGQSWRSFEKNGGHTIDAHKPIRTGLWQAIEKAQALKNGNGARRGR